MPTPSLGYGQRAEAPINAVNQYMRSAPWYQQLIASFGQDPNNVHLNDSQKQQVIRAAQANGITVDEGHNGQEVDDSGNFQAKSHALRNTLEVAGIAGAALLTMGAAGVFAGGAGAAGAGAGAGAGAAAGGGAGAAAGAGTLGSTVIGSGFIPGIAGGAGLAGGAGTGVGMGSTLAGVGKFLSSSAGSSVLGTAGNIFTNIYGANKQASANEDAARLADAATQRAEQFSREQAEGGWQSSEHTQKANYDQWRARQDAIMGSLGQQLGIHYTAPDYSPGIDPRYTGGAASPTGAPAGTPPPATAGTGAGAAEMKALLDGGLDPKAAVAQFNQKYGRSTGNEAVYYDPSQHGGVATIGLPDAYLAKPGASWDITNRSGAAAPAAPKPLAATFARPNFVPVPTPYQPGTLGAYVGS